MTDSGRTIYGVAGGQSLTGFTGEFIYLSGYDAWEFSAADTYDEFGGFGTVDDFSEGPPSWATITGTSRVSISEAGLYQIAVGGTISGPGADHTRIVHVLGGPVALNARCWPGTGTVSTIALSGFLALDPAPGNPVEIVLTFLSADATDVVDFADFYVYKVL